MSNNFNPGDINVEYLTLDSPRGFLDMTLIFQTFEIYESVFTPGVVGYFNIVDTENYMGEYKISGDETVALAFSPPGGSTSTYTLSLNSVDDVTASGSKAKIYRLTCVSKEALNARTNMVSKSYQTQISGMVSDVFKTFLKSSKAFNVEPTKGIQRFIAPQQKPFSLIKDLRKRAVSMINKSSNFVFFENVDGFNFVTLESLFDKDIVKRLKHVDTTGSSIPQTDDNNIISYKITRQGSAIDRIGLGSLNTVIQAFDIRTKKYTSEIKKTNESDFKISGPISSSFFKGLFGNTPGAKFFINKDSMDPKTFLDEESANKSSHLAALMQIQINIEIYGDTVYKAGKCVYAEIPKAVSTTGIGGTETLVNGKFLITKLAHICNKPNIRPRYINSMELIKTGFDNG